MTDATRQQKAVAEEDSGDIVCAKCKSGEDTPDNKILLCDGEGCQRGYHMRCLQPGLSEVPAGDWYCCECSVSMTTTAHDVALLSGRAGASLPCVQASSTIVHLAASHSGLVRLDSFEQYGKLLARREEAEAEKLPALALIPTDTYRDTFVHRISGHELGVVPRTLENGLALTSMKLKGDTPTWSCLACGTGSCLCERVQQVAACLPQLNERAEKALRRFHAERCGIERAEQPAGVSVQVDDLTDEDDGVGVAPSDKQSSRRHVLPLLTASLLFLLHPREDSPAETLAVTMTPSGSATLDVFSLQRLLSRNTFESFKSIKDPVRAGEFVCGSKCLGTSSSEGCPPRSGRFTDGDYQAVGACLRQEEDIERLVAEKAVADGIARLGSAQDSPAFAESCTDWIAQHVEIQGRPMVFIPEHQHESLHGPLFFAASVAMAEDRQLGGVSDPSKHQDWGSLARVDGLGRLDIAGAYAHVLAAFERNIKTSSVPSDACLPVCIWRDQATGGALLGLQASVERFLRDRSRVVPMQWSICEQLASLAGQMPMPIDQFRNHCLKFFDDTRTPHEDVLATRAFFLDEDGGQVDCSPEVKAIVQGSTSAPIPLSYVIAHLDLIARLKAVLSAAAMSKFVKLINALDKVDEHVDEGSMSKGECTGQSVITVYCLPAVHGSGLPSVVHASGGVPIFILLEAKQVTVEGGQDIPFKYVAFRASVVFSEEVLVFQYGEQLGCHGAPPHLSAPYVVPVFLIEAFRFHHERGVFCLKNTNMPWLTMLVPAAASRLFSEVAAKLASAGLDSLPAGDSGSASEPSEWCDCDSLGSFRKYWCEAQESAPADRVEMEPDGASLSSWLMYDVTACNAMYGSLCATCPEILHVMHVWSTRGYTLHTASSFRQILCATVGEDNGEQVFTLVIWDSGGCSKALPVGNSNTVRFVVAPEHSPTAGSIAAKVEAAVQKPSKARKLAPIGPPRPDPSASPAAAVRQDQLRTAIELASQIFPALAVRIAAGGPLLFLRFIQTRCRGRRPSRSAHLLIEYQAAVLYPPSDSSAFLWRLSQLGGAGILGELDSVAHEAGNSRGSVLANVQRLGAKTVSVPSALGGASGPCLKNVLQSQWRRSRADSRGRSIGTLWHLVKETVLAFEVLRNWAPVDSQNTRASNEDATEGEDGAEEGEANSAKRYRQDQPKEPLSAFLLFSHDATQKFNEHGEVGGRELTSRLAEEWGRLSEDEKATWHKAAVDEVERYTRQLATHLPVSTDTPPAARGDTQATPTPQPAPTSTPSTSERRLRVGLPRRLVGPSHCFFCKGKMTICEPEPTWCLTIDVLCSIDVAWSLCKSCNFQSPPLDIARTYGLEAAYSRRLVFGLDVAQSFCTAKGEGLSGGGLRDLTSFCHNTFAKVATDMWGGPKTPACLRVVPENVQSSIVNALRVALTAMFHPRPNEFFSRTACAKCGWRAPHRACDGCVGAPATVHGAKAVEAQEEAEEEDETRFDEFKMSYLVMELHKDLAEQARAGGVSSSAIAWHGVTEDLSKLDESQSHEAQLRDAKSTWKQPYAGGSLAFEYFHLPGFTFFTVYAMFPGLCSLKDYPYIFRLVPPRVVAAARLNDFFSCTDTKKSVFRGGARAVSNLCSDEDIHYFDTFVRDNNLSYLAHGDCEDFDRATAERRKHLMNEYYELYLPETRRPELRGLTSLSGPATSNYFEEMWRRLQHGPVVETCHMAEGPQEARQITRHRKATDFGEIAVLEMCKKTGHGNFPTVVARIHKGMESNADFVTALIGSTDVPTTIACDTGCRMAVSLANLHPPLRERLGARKGAPVVPGLLDGRTSSVRSLRVQGRATERGEYQAAPWDCLKSDVWRMWPAGAPDAALYWAMSQHSWAEPHPLTGTSALVVVIESFHSPNHTGFFCEAFMSKYAQGLSGFTTTGPERHNGAFKDARPWLKQMNPFHQALFTFQMQDVSSLKALQAQLGHLRERVPSEGVCLAYNSLQQVTPVCSFCSELPEGGHNCSEMSAGSSMNSTLRDVDCNQHLSFASLTILLLHCCNDGGDYQRTYEVICEGRQQLLQDREKQAKKTADCLKEARKWDQEWTAASSEESPRGGAFALLSSSGHEGHRRVPYSKAALLLASADYLTSSVFQAGRVRILYNWPGLGWIPGVLLERNKNVHILVGGYVCNFVAIFQHDNKFDVSSPSPSSKGSARKSGTRWARRRRRPVVIKTPGTAETGCEVYSTWLHLQMALYLMEGGRIQDDSWVFVTQEEQRRDGAACREGGGEGSSSGSSSAHNPAWAAQCGCCALDVYKDLPEHHDSGEKQRREEEQAAQDEAAALPPTQPLHSPPLSLSHPQPKSNCGEQRCAGTVWRWQR